jgi:iron complex transport system substrate-binding protein
MSVSPKPTRALLPSVLLTLVLAACASSGSGTTAPEPSAEPTAPATAGPSATAPTSTATPGAFPVTVEAANGAVEIAEQPGRIVSLSPTATEMLFAIGAGDQVIAVDEQSDYPEDVPTTDLSGYTPNVEAIAGYEPDLVVAASDSTEGESLVASLGELGIPVLVHPSANTLDEAYSQIERLGAATGHVAGAAEVVAQMQTELEDIVAAAPDLAEPPAIYHELDPTFYSATSSTFIGGIYEQFGVENIADAAEEASGNAYPQLSAEYIVEADPDVIFLADAECCDVTPESLADRPGWEQITAVEQGNVVPVDEDIASRWGPRVVDFAASVGEALDALEPATTD